MNLLLWSMKLLHCIKGIGLDRARFFMVMFITIPAHFAWAQVHSDSLSVTVYYPCGSTNLSQIAGNTLSLERFIAQLDSIKRSSFTHLPMSLFVTSSASPEGSLAINRTLARKRNQAVVNWLNQRSETFRAITNSPDCKLRELTSNHQFGEIPSSAYASLRYSRVTLLYQRTVKDPAPEVKPSVVDTLQSNPVVEKESGQDAQTSATIAPDAQTIVSTPVLFVKTNLLYDLLTCVNVSVEMPLTKRLTAEATLIYPWWRSMRMHKTMQIRCVNITPRYYFSDADNPYTSFFTGLSVGGGIYDLQFTRRGVQGSMWHVSPVLGYTHYIGKRWKLEYSAAIGYLNTKYEKYTQVDDTRYGDIKVKDYPWVKTIRHTVFPTSLNVSLVYTFHKIKKS